MIGVGKVERGEEGEDTVGLGHRPKEGVEGWETRGAR